MGFQEVVGGDYISWSEKPVGHVGVEGWYLGTIPSNYEHPNFQFLTREGQKKIVNTCGFIRKAMESIRPGDMVQMVYMGMGVTSEKSKFKNRPQHMVKVLVDPAQRALVQDGLFLGMAPAAALHTSPIASAQVATHVAPTASVPVPSPEPVATDDLDW